MQMARCYNSNHSNGPSLICWQRDTLANEQLSTKWSCCQNDYENLADSEKSIDDKNIAQAIEECMILIV